MHLDPLISSAPEGKCQELPSLFADPSLRPQLGPRGWTRPMINAQGLKIATYFWPARAEHKATIVLLHGHGAYLFEYLKAQGPGKAVLYAGSWVERLNDAGIAVCGIDTQSCGFSEGCAGLRNYIESFEYLVNDVVQFRRSIDEQSVGGFVGQPTFVMGLSMGGALAVQTIRSAPDLFKGSVLLAPMLSLERVSKKGWNPYLRPLSGFMSYWFPWAQIVAVHRNPLYPEIQAEWDADPLTYHGNTRARNAVEFLRVTEEVVASMPTMDFPFIVFHGELDTLCDPDGSRQLFEKSAAEDKELVLLPDMWHILVKEKGQEKIIAHIIDWLAARC